ncbi:uncharacterized protein LOC141850059 isoform X2 [Brevipalpus obovatus]|uniref:uncharacterized protein LOC141850059 isoform X2 n=1 Tax=Brevipalpus obovatus TaxID=246614 RepID=UPI003D9EDED4
MYHLPLLDGGTNTQPFPGPTSELMNNIAMYVPGSDETSRMLRRTLMRYLNLTLVLVLRSISIAVKRRFPTKEHLVEAGFMTKQELEMHVSVPSTEFNTFWIPCTWFINLLREARQECRITDSSGLKLIMEEFNEFRSKCGLLWSYDWVSIPLVYTQVVTIATYSFFIASLFGRQPIDINPKVFNVEIEHRYEPYIPVFTILQFLLYMGLLKLGEQLINPFGDDDEDFELNWIIDRHLKVSFLGVDILNNGPPPMVKDNYWDDWDIKLPYTAAAVTYKKKTYRGSMAAYHVPSEQQGLVVPDFTEDEECDYDSVSDKLSKKDKSSSSIFGSMFGGGKLGINSASKRIESLASLNSDNFEYDPPFNSQWRGSSISFLMGSGDEDNRKQMGPQKQESEESDKPGGIIVGSYGSSIVDTDRSSSRKVDSQIQPEQVQGIRGDFRTRKRPRKASDQTSITLLSSGSGNEDKSSDQGRGGTLSSTGSGPITGNISSTSWANRGDTNGDNNGGSGGSSSRRETNFDPTMGIFTNRYRVENTSPARRSSNASLFRHCVGKDVKGSPDRSVSTTSPPSNYGRFETATVIESSTSHQINYEIGVTRSSSSASTSRKSKPGLLKGLSKADPRLKIRPFVKSRVTFSDDTKSELKDTCGYYRYIRFNQPDTLNDLTLSSPELSEADLISAYSLRGRNDPSRRASTLVPPVTDKAILVDTSKPLTSQTLVKQLPTPVVIHPSTSQRRTSYDQVNESYSPDVMIPASCSSEFWLRHQSLPNIQEIVEESPHQSPTSTEGGADFGLLRMGSRKSRNFDAIKSDNSKGDQGSGMQRAPRPLDIESGHGVKQLSRQSEFDEDCPIDMGSSGPLTADERRNQYSKDSAGSSNSATAGDSHQNLFMIKYASGRSINSGKTSKQRPGNRGNNSKQSSTDSESGSYATACSVFVPICEERSKNVANLTNFAKLSFNSTDSSISSFSSAKDQQSADLMVISGSVPTSSSQASGLQLSSISGDQDNGAKNDTNDGADESIVDQEKEANDESTKDDGEEKVPKIVVGPSSSNNSESK